MRKNTTGGHKFGKGPDGTYSRLCTPRGKNQGYYAGRFTQQKTNFHHETFITKVKI